MVSPTTIENIEFNEFCSEWFVDNGSYSDLQVRMLLVYELHLIRKVLEADYQRTEKDRRG